MDSTTRQLWQTLASRYNKSYGVFRRTGSKGSDAPWVEEYRPERRKQYIEIVRPEKVKP